MPVQRVNGRKRHIVADTQPRLLAVVVHPEDIHGRDGATLVLQRMAPGLILLWVDSGYS